MCHKNGCWHEIAVLYYKDFTLYLDKKAEESNKVVISDALDDLATKEWRIILASSNAQFEIENIFVSCH